MPGSRRPRLSRQEIEALIYGGRGATRFTQDSPILLDVWIRYAEEPDRPHELLITPYQDPRHGTTSPGELAKKLKEALGRPDALAGTWGTAPRTGAPHIAYNQTTVLAQLRFDELVRVVLPLSAWWYGMKYRAEMLRLLQTPEGQVQLQEALVAPQKPSPLPPELVWVVHVIGSIALLRAGEADSAAAQEFVEAGGEPDDAARRRYYARLVDRFAALVRGLENDELAATGSRPMVWSVSLNRRATATVFRSRGTVKADAAIRLFQITCHELGWAVIDSGIDARHVAFRRRDSNGVRLDSAFAGERNNTRVVATYDFTIVRELLNEATMKEALARIGSGATWKEADRQALADNLQAGRDIDWQVLGRLIQVPHTEGGYRRPVHEHGTHVAGILAGDCRKELKDEPTDDLPVGLCPDLQLYDLRVLDDRGEGDEFNVMAALQFVRYLNAHQQAMVAHGVNLSLSIRHDIANFACGRTPVCEECERLVGAGIVVVAAAGNEGYLQYLTPRGPQDSYRSISITDPGNAAGVITVGSTHRFQPHTYGVSYFSSRGPTGDGRAKPDLVAPGEKIEAAVGGEDGLRRMDGTSMAAPHVSGAAALLIGRHRELAGQPARIKRILCDTATDLGREHYFQGAGMVDVLRALQSV